MKSTATPYSCAKCSIALTNATMTNSDVTMAAIVAYSTALFNNLARRFRRKISALRYDLSSDSEIA